MPVYFLKRHSDPPVIKIGYSRTPERVLKSFSKYSFEPVELIRLKDGPPRLERWFHQQFQHQNLRDDWFSYHPDMLTTEPPASLPIRRHGNMKIRVSFNELVVMKKSGKSLRAIAAEVGVSAERLRQIFLKEGRQDLTARKIAPPRTCAHCKAETGSQHRKYCSKECRSAAAKARPVTKRQHEVFDTVVEMRRDEKKWKEISGALGYGKASMALASFQKTCEARGLNHRKALVRGMAGASLTDLIAEQTTGEDAA